MDRRTRYSPEVRERAVRMVFGTSQMKPVNARFAGDIGWTSLTGHRML